jgi:hypothetical protein
LCSFHGTKDNFELNEKHENIRNLSSNQNSYKISVVTKLKYMDSPNPSDPRVFFWARYFHITIVLTLKVPPSFPRPVVYDGWSYGAMGLPFYHLPWKK